jgi:hypothetical protein
MRNEAADGRKNEMLPGTASILRTPNLRDGFRWLLRRTNLSRLIFS